MECSPYWLWYKENTSAHMESLPLEEGSQKLQRLFGGLMRKDHSRNMMTLFPGGHKGNGKQAHERVIKWLSLRWKEQLS